MILRKAVIKNFMPFRGKYELEFPEGIMNVVATYENEPGRSNRGGKSSFIDAIMWALYGKSRAKKEVELVHDGEEECSVKLWLEHNDGRMITIHRVRRADNTGALDVRGLEGEKKAITQAAIDELLGMNYDECLNTSYFKQNDIDQFMQATPQEKKALLMRWLQQTAWPSYEVEAKAYLMELQRMRDGIRAQLEALGDGDFDKEALVARKRAIDVELKELGEHAAQVAAEKRAYEMRLAKLKDTGSLAARAQDCLNKAQRLRQQRPDSTSYSGRLKQLEDALAKYPLVDEAKCDEYRHKRNEAVRVMGEAGLKLRQLNEEKSRAKRDRTGVCPILKETCDRIQLTPDYLADLDSKIEDCMAKQTKATTIRDKCEQWVNLHDKQRQWSAEKEQLYEKANLSTQIEEQIASLESEHDELMAQVPEDLDDARRDANAKLAICEGEGRGIDAKRAQLQREMGGISEAYKAGKRAAERKAELAAQLETTEIKLSDATYVTYMFGKNGIPSIELENSFGEIENEANVILRKLHAPFQVEFQATRELQDWEANCLACSHVYARGTKKHQCPECGVPREKKRKDELTLRVLEGGKERAFYLDSGGGQVLQSVAMRIALARLVQRRTGSAWATLFMDEVFGSLDSVNRKAMADLLTTTLTKEFGFKQVFIISHVPGIQSATADVVKVFRRKGGYSELSIQ